MCRWARKDPQEACGSFNVLFELSNRTELLTSGLLRFFAAGLENAAALSFGRSAPDAVINTVREGVLEASIDDGALHTDPLCDLDTYSIAREEGFRGLVCTQTLCLQLGSIRYTSRCSQDYYAQTAPKVPVKEAFWPISPNFFDSSNMTDASLSLDATRVRCREVGSCRGKSMSDTMDEQLPAQGHAKIVYNGPIAPHWDIRAISGDAALMDGFRERVTARLLLLPPHDPQFRRNRERVNRDGERERIYIEWDLGYEEDSEAANSTGRS